MKKPVIGATGLLALKGVHLTASVIWLGAVAGANILRWLWVLDVDGSVYTLDHTIRLMERHVEIPAALVAIVTGFLASWLSTWGFIIYRWVIVKWSGTLAVLLLSGLFKLRWSNAMEAISRVEGLAALQDPVYLQLQTLNTLVGIALIIMLVALPFVAVLKPWRRQDRANLERSGRKARAVVEVEG